MSQTPFEAYVMFCAIRTHFQSDTYDYFKYQKKVKASKPAFDKRNDKFRFEKLARMPDNELRVAATFVEGGKWIGDVCGEQGRDSVLKHKKYIETCSRSFEKEMGIISRLDKPLVDLLYPEGGITSPIISLYFRKKISLETLCILDDFYKISRGWELKYPYDPLVKNIVLNVRKFKSFFTYNREKIRQILVDWL